MNNLDLNVSYWASVSGGKDSLYMLKYLIEHKDVYKLDGVVHFELEIDYPFVKNVIALIENECNKYNIPFVRIKPRTSFFELYDLYGMPTRKVRWCNGKYKLDCKLQMVDYFKSKNTKVIFYIGYCYDEFKRYENKNNPFEIYPLVDGKIYEDIILEWAKSVDIFNNYYKFNKRLGCMFCPMSDLNNLAYLYYFYPKEYNIFISLCKNTENEYYLRTGKYFSIFQSNPKYNTDYYDKIVKTKYLPKLISSLNYDIISFFDNL